METNYQTWPKDRLISKLYDLEATVEALKVVVSDNMVLTIKEKFNITFKEARLLNALADGKAHTKRALFEYVYHDEFDDPPEMKIIDVFMSKVRKKILPHGLVVETIHGAGYRLTDPSLLTRVVEGEEIATAEITDRPWEHRKHGENEKAVLAALIMNMDSSGKSRIGARALARAAKLKVSLRPILESLERKNVIQIRSQPSRANKSALYVVHVRARAL